MINQEVQARLLLGNTPFREKGAIEMQKRVSMEVSEVLATFGLISAIENSISVYRQFINDELTFISRTKAPFEWHLIFKWAPLEGQTEEINTLPTEKIPSVSSSSSAGRAVKPVPTSLLPGTATLFNTSSDRTPHSTTQTSTEVSTTVSSSDGRTVNPKVGVTTDLPILNSSDHKTVKPASKLAKTNVTTVIDTKSTIGVTTSASPTEATTPELTKTPTKPSPLTVSTPAKHNTATQTTTAFPLHPLLQSVIMGQKLLQKFVTKRCNQYCTLITFHLLM